MFRSIIHLLLLTFLSLSIACNTTTQTAQTAEAEAPAEAMPSVEAAPTAPPNPPASSYVSMTTEDFSQMLQNLTSPQLIDVRTPGEVEAGYIPGATNININGSDFNEKVSQLDPDQPILVYCAAGGRSKRAADALLKLGFRDVYELDGGFTDWKAKGMEIETK